jgi:chloride channel 3/4/5
MTDWIHEVVKASAREKHIHSLTGVREVLMQNWDKLQGWIAVVIIGFITAVVAFLVDIAQATVFE